MNKFIRVALAITLGMVSLVVIQAAPVQAAAKRIYINETLTSDWPVSSARSWVDGYTGSTMVWGSCRENTDCITIKAGRVSGGAVGWTKGVSVTKTTGGLWGQPKKTVKYTRWSITIDTAKAKRYGYTSAHRLYLLDHELGHVFGVGHGSRCVSRSWPYMKCSNGRVPPRTWTTSERRVLRAH